MVALRLETLLRANADPDHPMGLDLTLLGADGVRTPLAAINRSLAREGPEAARIEFAFGRVFAITAHADPAFLALHPTRAGSIIALLGLLLTAVVTVLVKLVQRRREELESLVLDRTAELQQSEQRYRAMAQVADRANASKSEFLANMSHEIRTPMNGVLGMAELLGESSLTPEQRDYLSAITRSSGSLLAILNDVLDVSKIEAGQLTLERVPFNLEELVFDVAELFRTRLEGRPVELLVDFDPALARHVLGDPGRLRQVLSNLVSNATKFTESGYILVSVMNAAALGGREAYRFVVIDTGIGIPADKVPRLFKPFSQADSSTGRRFGGTGLGLTLVKRLVEAMDGQVCLESLEGTGTSLVVDLPLQADPAALPEPLLRELEGRRILVIDDLEINQRLLSRQLEAHGAQTGTCASGEAALAELARAVACGQPYAAALVDLLMPGGMDGAAFGQEAMADPRFQGLAMVVLTSTGTPGDPARLERLGFDGYFTKPIPGDTLARAMAAALVRAGSGRASPLVTRYLLKGDPQASAPKGRLTLQARILLVEDHEVNQAVARKFLERAGAVVTTAGNGRAALEAVAAAPFDLVLMDCQLPDMDGFEATIRIRAQEAGTERHLPIVAMTAHAMAGDRDRCLQVGMDDYLTKPITRDTLLRGVARWVPSRMAAWPPETPRGGAPAPGFPVPPRHLEVDLVQLHKVWEAYGQDPQAMANGVIEPFLRRGEELLGTLRQALAEGRPEAARKAAHALKGASRTLACNALGRIAERIEREGGTAAPAALADWVEEAVVAFAAACRFLQDIVTPRSQP